MKRRGQQEELPKEEEVHIGGEEEESLSPEEAQAKIATMLAKSENLETLSETTDDEVKLMSALSAIGQKYELSLLNQYLNRYLSLKVSLHRQGRKEISEIARPSAGTEEKAKASLKQMLLGGVLGR